MDNKTNQRPVSKWLAGGTPKTTVEMGTASTFLDADLGLRGRIYFLFASKLDSTYNKFWLRGGPVGYEMIKRMRKCQPRKK